MAKVEKEMTMLRYTKRFYGDSYDYENIEVTETLAPELLKDRVAELQALFGEASSVVSHSIETDEDGVAEVSLDGEDDNSQDEVVEKHKELYEELKEKPVAPAPKKRGRKPKAPVVPEPEDSEDVDDETEIEEAPKAKKVRTATTPYNRTSDFHRKLVSEMLEAEVTNWKKMATKVKQVSQAMDGKAMLTGEGDMLPEFKSEFIGLVKAK